MRFWVIILAAVLSASPAHAGPVAAAIGSLITAVSTFAASSWLAGFLVRTVTSMALSALAKALRKEPRPPGIQTDATTSGGTTPQKFIVGRYATGGQLIAPPNSFGKVRKTPRAYLVYPVALSVVAGCSLERVIIDDEYVTWQSTLSEWGVEAAGALEGYAWIDYEDGSQTAAHAAMLEVFGDDVDRPWMSDMVGPGTCCAYLKFRYDREQFNGLPAVRFEMLGIPLYDPRKDSSVGGAGAHRWEDRGTWEQTENPIVIIYNILRGIDVGAGMTWGGECEEEDLPLAGWFAAMNECDVSIDLGDGNSEPQFRCGLEIALSDEPAEVIEELLKTCSGSIVEVGGIWKPRVGPPALPTFYFTDDDIVINAEQQFDEFPSLVHTFNGITATYPDPESLWEVRDAPPRYNPEWETDDGGRRLVADLTLPACPYPAQVQRLMTALIADHRRFRTHSFALPPEAAVLEPLETIGWSSARFGYTAKTFEITAQNDGLMTLIQRLSLRERDQGDYVWEPGDIIVLDPVASGTTPPRPQTPDFTFAAGVIVDQNSTNRRAAIDISWDGEQATDASGILWEARLSNEMTASLAGSYAAVDAGFLRVVEGVLPGADYLVRATFRVDRPVLWTAWVPVQTPNVLISAVDIAADMIAQIEQATSMANAAAVAVAAAALDAAAVRADLDAAVEALGLVGSQIGTAVDTEAVARVAADQALAAQVNSVSASIGSVSAAVTQQAAAIADLEGNASAGYLIRAQAGGAVSLIDLVAADGGGGTPTSVARIAASSILLDGSVGTDQLAVGLGRNLLSNTDFSDGLNGWMISSATGAGGGASVLALRAAGITYAGTYFPTLMVSQASAASDGYCNIEHHPKMPDGLTATGVPVTPGAWVDVSVRASVHRCAFELRVRFSDASGATLGYSGILATANDVKSSSTNPEQWPTYWGKAQVPVGAAYATLQMRKLATNSGASPATSYLYIHKPQLAVTSANATVPVPYGPGGTTLITGGKVITQTLFAEHLNTLSLGVAGVGIFGGELKSSNFVAGVSGWSIQHDGSAEFNDIEIRGDLVALNSLSTAASSLVTDSYLLTGSSTAWVDLATVTLNVRAGRQVFIDASWRWRIEGAGGNTQEIRLTDNSGVTLVSYDDIREGSSSVFSRSMVMFAHSASVTGARTYRLQVRKSAGSDRDILLKDRMLRALGILNAT